MQSGREMRRISEYVQDSRYLLVISQARVCIFLGREVQKGADFRLFREIKNQYDHMNLSDFEISQLLNLRPKNLDEARVLITR